MTPSSIMLAPWRWLQRVGPAIIVGSVVLGPGSMLVASKVGCQHGYTMLWILVTASLLMISMTALAARIGLGTNNTLCGELANRFGRPYAVLIGTLLFLVVASFQSSNNMAVVTSIQTVLSSPDRGAPSASLIISSLVLFNGLIVAVMFGLKNLYKPLEWMMKFLLLVMLLGFGANLVLAGIAPSDILRGLVPTVSWDVAGGFWPARNPQGQVLDPLWAVQGMIATTFSVAAAFYQGYLVKEKGWTVANLRQGLTDSIFGVSILGGCSAMIMITSASVFHGKLDPDQLRTAADVAGQLEPLFGPGATLLFGFGLFAACFSSFLVNAMIGGLLLSDGLGLGGSIDQPWPRRLTVLALLAGMAVAVFATISGQNPVNVIIFAQALTVLGLPLIAWSLMYLASCRDIRQAVKIPHWMYGMCAIGTVVTIILAARTAWKLYLNLSGG